MGNGLIYDNYLKKDDIFSSIEKSIKTNISIINNIKENESLLKDTRECKD